jgi:hypothetical protein
VPPTTRINTRSACESFATRTFAPLPAKRELTYAERGLAIAERSGPAGSPLQTAALDEMASLQDRLGDHAAAATLRARTLASWSGFIATGDWR